MADRPTTIPTWATDTTYTSGVGDGNPTKLTPSASVQTQGYNWQDQLPAPFYNWQLNLIGKWLENLAKQSALLKAANALGPMDINTGSTWEQIQIGIKYSSTTDSFFLVADDGTDLVIYESAEGHIWDVGDSPAHADAVFACAIGIDDDNDRIMIGAGTTCQTKSGIARTGFSGATSFTNSVFDIIYVERLGLWVAGVGDPTSGIETSDDFGATWTQRATSGVFVTTLIDTGTTLVGLGDGAGGEVVYSTDGTSWTAVDTAANALYHGAYEPVNGIIVAANETLVLLSDDDGATWSDITPAVGFFQESPTVVVEADYIMLITNSFSGENTGIALVSTDLGATWDAGPSPYLRIDFAGYLGARIAKHPSGYWVAGLVDSANDLLAYRYFAG